jgi:uncharacterized membrane protein
VAELPTSSLIGSQESPPGFLSSRVRRIRRRVVTGLLVALPFIVTFWIVYWLYSVLEAYLIAPAARLVILLAEGRQNSTPLPPWFADYVAPILGILSVVLLLYLLGYVASWRLFALIDKLLLRVPVVTVIHTTVMRVFRSLSGQHELSRFKRVVLVAFPHPGMRVPAFVTSSCRDVKTQRTILCVYVPTTPIPTSGYMLLVPEEEVTDLDWELDETIQAVVSFGLTAPPIVRYDRESSTV